MAVACAGVPVAAEVARLLFSPLGIVPVVNLKGPNGEIFAALAPGGAALVNWRRLERVGEEAARAIAVKGQLEVTRLERIYGELARLPLARRSVLLIADAMETGMAMRVALRTVRAGHPARVIAATPVATADACREVRAEGCECVCLVTAEAFHTTGEWYGDIREPMDSESLGHLQHQARHGRLTVA